MKMPKLLWSAFVIARRDFVATVLSRTFILFLIGPLFPLLIGGVFGGIGATVAGDVAKPTIGVIASHEDFARLSQPQTLLRHAMGESPVKFLHYPLRGDPVLQMRSVLRNGAPPTAVLIDPFGQPRLTGAVDPLGRTAGQVRLLLAQARVGDGQPSLQIVQVRTQEARQGRSRTLTAHAGQAILFFLTLLLAGMLLSQLIEEKSSKVIEVLAAAVPVEGIFVGKLFAMLATSLIGIAIWSLAGGLALLTLAPQAFANLPAPAVGWPLFGLFSLLYFSMSYLILGAAFLGIGALASTARQVQILSMPVTMSQVVIFGFASAATASLNGFLGLFATVFPLSSPYLMLARAGLETTLWPHLLAVAWQALWVALILRLAARVFRRSVLRSGPRRRWFGLGKLRPV